MKHGDPHNGGKSVVTTNAAAIKPRPILWEWLLLAVDSDLRRAIATSFSQKIGHSPFDCVPYLGFRTNPNLLEGGEVELFSGPGWLGPPTSEECYRLGLYCGLMTFLGVSDLHDENITVQCGAGLPFVFACVDVESVFLDISDPRGTGLIPARAKSPHHHGLSLLPCELPAGGPVRLVRGYADAVIGLTSLAGDIADIIAMQPRLGDCPIRILPRDTSCYYAFLEGRGALFAPHFSVCETTQLGRGDIPYYFCTLNDPTLRYWSEGGEPRPSTIAADLLKRLPSLFDPRSATHLRRRGLKTAVRGAMELADYLMSDTHRGCVSCGGDALAVCDDALFLDIAGTRAHRPKRWFRNCK